MQGSSLPMEVPVVPSHAKRKRSTSSDGCGGGDDQTGSSYTFNPSHGHTSTPQPGIQQQPSRRAHPKSRTGCKTCKTRKIKCDEQKPSCRNCIKHGVECDFLAALSSAMGRGRAREVDGNEGSDSTGHNPIPDLNLLDLELLHNFTTATYATLSTDLHIQNFYRINIVRIGLRCDYVMRALLAVSGLHLAHYRPDRKEYYVSQSLLYHQLASRQAMNLMGSPNKENGANLFVFSILTLYFALGSPRRPGDMLLMGESSFPDWMFLSRGTRTMFNLLGMDHDPYNGPLSPLLLHGQKRWLGIYEKSGPEQRRAFAEKPGQERRMSKTKTAKKDVDAQESENRARNKHHDEGGQHHLQVQPNPASSTASPLPPSAMPDAHLSVPTTTSRPATVTTLTHSTSNTAIPAPLLLPTPDTSPPLLDAQTCLNHLEDRVKLHVKNESLRDIYVYAIGELRPTLEVFFPAPGQELPGDLDITDAFVWIYTVSDSFLPLLQEPDQKQEAVAIFMHFAACLTKITQHWWLQGWGGHLMKRAWEMLDHEHRLWVRWPVEVSGFIETE